MIILLLYTEKLGIDFTRKWLYTYRMKWYQRNFRFTATQVMRLEALSRVLKMNNTMTVHYALDKLFDELQPKVKIGGRISKSVRLEEKERDTYRRKRIPGEESEDAS